MFVKMYVKLKDNFSRIRKEQIPVKSPRKKGLLFESNDKKIAKKNKGSIIILNLSYFYAHKRNEKFGKFF